jgi:hypothetical protein
METVSGVSADFLAAHNWRYDKRINDKVLDAYNECLRDGEKAQEFYKKIKRVRSGDSLFERAEEYSKFFEKVEKNVEGFREVIKA